MRKLLLATIVAVLTALPYSVHAQSPWVRRGAPRVENPIQFGNCYANGSEPTSPAPLVGTFLCSSTDGPGDLRVYDGTNWNTVGGGGAVGFDMITTGVNTVPAVMTLGNGSSLTFAGTGTVTASTLTSTGPNTINLAADTLGLTIEADAGQSSNLLNFDASGGATQLAWFDANAGLFTPYVATGDAWTTTETIGGVGFTSSLSVGDDSAGMMLDLLVKRSTAATAATSGQLVFLKSRGTDAAETVVVTGDQLGQIDAGGHDGTDFVSSASILFEAAGTIGNDRVPSQMRLFTSTDAAPSVRTLAVTIDETQVVTFANPPTSPGVAANTELFGAGAVGTANNTAVLGNGASAGANSEATAIGAGAAVVGIGGSAFGQGSNAGTAGTSLGFLAASGAQGIALGAAANAPGNNFVVGSSSNPITTVFTGEGTTSATPGTLLWSGTGAAGNDLGTSNITFQTQLPTGTGAGNGGALGGFAFTIANGDTGTAAGTQHTPVTALTITNTLGAGAQTPVVTIPAGVDISSPGAGAGSEAFGSGAVAAGAQGTALGNTASAAGADTVSVGYNSSASAGQTLAVGEGTVASQVAAVAVGYRASSTGGTAGTAIGYLAVTSQIMATAVGAGATGSAQRTSVFGHTAVCANNDSQCYGQAATSTATNQLVFGSTTSPILSMYIGEGPETPLAGDLLVSGSVSQTADAGGGDVTFQHALCDGACTAGSTKVGRLIFDTADGVDRGAGNPMLTTTVMTMGTTVVGTSPSVIVPNGVDFSSPGAGTNSFVAGVGATAAGGDATVIGDGAAAAGNFTVAYGRSSTASGLDTVAIGFGASATNSNCTAIGKSAVASSASDTAIGRGADATGGSSLAIGQDAQATGVASVAIGAASTTASGARSQAFGAQAVCAHTNSQCYGQAATSADADQLIFGADGFEITSVWLGEGPETTTAGDLLISGSVSQTADAGGGDVTFQHALADGDATAGSTKIGNLIFQASDGVDLGAGTPQATTVAMTIGPSALAAISAVEFNQPVVWEPTSDQSLAAGTQVPQTSALVRVAGNGGAVVLTGTPTIDDTVPTLADGQEICIQGTHDTNTVTLQDEAQLANTDLQLANNADFVLGQGDLICLIYDLGEGKWLERTRSAN